MFNELLIYLHVEKLIKRRLNKIMNSNYLILKNLVFVIWCVLNRISIYFIFISKI